MGGRKGDCCPFELMSEEADSQHFHIIVKIIQSSHVDGGSRPQEQTCRDFY
jgi:hypothetical protein